MRNEQWRREICLPPANLTTPLCTIGEPAGAGLDDAALMLQRHGVQVEPDQGGRLGQ